MEFETHQKLHGCFRDTQFAFFDDFSILKRFDETNFIKPFGMPMAIMLNRLFANYFSVLCLFL